MTYLQKKIIETLKELQVEIKKKYNISINPKITYDLKSIKTLGAYNKKNNQIRLDNELLEEFKDVYINKVFIHEFAHAVVGELYDYRVKPHGKEFKEICYMLNISGKATLDSFKNSEVLKRRKEKKNKRKKTFLYKCNCKTFELSTIRHNKIKNKKSFYICKKCKEKIVKV